MSDSRPIGVFNSGVGGLTVLREIRRQMPAERLIYVADLEHFPYGPRSQAQVRGLALDIIGMLAGMDTKLVVIACNTATAAALHAARERFDIPVVGVIAPGAQAAAAATRNGRVAVLSTEGTRASGEYVHAIREANPGIVVLVRSRPTLSPSSRTAMPTPPPRTPHSRLCSSASSTGTPIPWSWGAPTTPCFAPRCDAGSERGGCVWLTARTRPQRGSAGSSRSTVSGLMSRLLPVPGR